MCKCDVYAGDDCDDCTVGLVKEMYVLIAFIVTATVKLISLSVLLMAIVLVIRFEK